MAIKTMTIEGKNSNENKKAKKAFIIAPIGSANEPTRRRIDGLIAEVFRPILEEFEYHAVASHEESDIGSISLKIVEHLLDDDLVVCDLTQNNPNVMYELAVRHFINKPIITVAEEGTKIPFDIGQDRVLLFKSDILGIRQFKEDLRKVLNSIKPNKKYDNPISRALNYQYILKQDDKKPSSEDKFDFIIERIKSLEEKLPIPNSNIIRNNLASAIAKARAKARLTITKLCIEYEANENLQTSIEHDLKELGMNINFIEKLDSNIVRIHFDIPPTSINTEMELMDLMDKLYAKYDNKIRFLTSSGDDIPEE